MYLMEGLVSGEGIGRRQGWTLLQQLFLSSELLLLYLKNKLDLSMLSPVVRIIAIIAIVPHHEHTAFRNKL